jgi:hypothetical protein
MFTDVCNAFGNVYIDENGGIPADMISDLRNIQKEDDLRQKSLTSIGHASFYQCSSLEEVDLLHTNVEELGGWAFQDCTSLREMKIPDSLQTFGFDVFLSCSKLVPSHINIDGDGDNLDNPEDRTSEVVAYLRSIQ